MPSPPVSSGEPSGQAGRPPRCGSELVMVTPIDGLSSTPTRTIFSPCWARGSLAAANAVARRWAVLLPPRPEPAQPGEGELGAGHLLDPPAPLAQDVDYRGVDARAVRAVEDLGVLVQQAMRHECDTHEASIQPAVRSADGPFRRRDRLPPRAWW